MSDWRYLLFKSLEKTRDMPESRYFQLATINAKGLPENRTVVCRGFEEEKGRILVVTDARNNKVPELESAPDASICWYFSKTREQYRLTVSASIGRLQNNTELCNEQWLRLSVAARQQFLWGEPGAVRQYPQRSLVSHQCNVTRAPAHFCVLMFTVTAVDYLNLRGNPQNRLKFECLNGTWHSQEIIP